MPVDKFGRMSDAKTRDTGVSLTYIDNNYIRSDGSTPVSGSIDMKGNTLYNVSDPVNPQDVTTKEYVDTVNKAFIFGDGRYMATDDLSMGECGFDRDPENIAISEGDVINIRTEKADNKCFLELFGLSVPDFSFLFTFLLELDPL